MKTVINNNKKKNSYSYGNEFIWCACRSLSEENKFHLLISKFVLNLLLDAFEMHLKCTYKTHRTKWKMANEVKKDADWFHYAKYAQMFTLCDREKNSTR